MAQVFICKAGRVEVRTVRGRADFEPVMRVERLAFVSHLTDAQLLGVIGDRKRKFVCRVATIHAEVVGYLIHEVRAPYAEVWRLAVYPLWQRQGVGRAMVAAAMGGMSLSKVTEVMARVPTRRGAASPERHGPAYRFFGALGFRGWNLDERYFGPGTDAIRLNRPLDG